MEERNTTAQQQRRDGGPTCNMHQRGTAFCYLFLRREGVKPIEIHRRMEVQYGDACLALQ